MVVIWGQIYIHTYCICIYVYLYEYITQKIYLWTYKQHLHFIIYRIPEDTRTA